MADDFVRVRLLRIQNVDINLFEFDWDLTWSVFFMHPDGKVYGRYGGRDASGADSRNTLAGLRYAMQAALATHRERQAEPPPARGKSLVITSIPVAKLFRSGECIHCHQVKEILRADAKEKGTWTRDGLWTYPLPENIGVTLDKDKGNLVKSVAAKSAAQAVGIEAGDFIDAIAGARVRSFADAQYALHHAPWTGAVDIAWVREGKKREGKLTLAAGWKKTNPTWRPSMLDLFPALALYGDDLTGPEKTRLGLAADQLAFRQTDPAPARVQAIGVRGGDVILGINDEKMTGSVEQFLAYVRRNYIVGDRVTLNLIRGGKRLDLPVRLSN